MSGRVTMRYIIRPTSRLYLTGSFNNSPSSGGVSLRYCPIGDLSRQAPVKIQSLENIVSLQDL